MNQEQARNALLALVEAAMPAMEALPGERRADCYDGIHLALLATSPELAQSAALVAQSLRDASARQLHFHRLLGTDPVIHTES